MPTSHIVCGVGVPHVPVFPKLVAEGDHDVRSRYEAVRAVLERTEPDLLVVVANDHLNAFFLDRLPTFSIGIGELMSGPMDDVPGLETGPLPTDTGAARALAESLVRDDYDLVLCQEIDVDHSVIVPLHFLNHMGVPVVVVNINAYVSPLPSAQRCHELGRSLGKAVEALAGDRRVAVVASGSFSQEVGGPRVDAGRAWSVPRPDWAGRIAELLTRGDIESLLAESTPVMLRDAGTVAGEVLSWITMIGAAGPAGANLSPHLDHRSGEAFAFGTWEER
ncbi:hypothetical protein M2162_009038 [Streptomyces sp. SAI-041]|nr:hypothetical protein [Streptomyces sp. SAI-041]